MTTRQALLVDAFTDEPFAGNPAGVVPDATGLDADQMQAIATEVNASETAFVQPSETADRRLRFFTPETEVDLCGHATIAAHAYLFERAIVDDETTTMETAAGVLDVEIDIDGTVWMDQSAPEVRAADLSYDEVADALGLDPATLRDVGADLPLSRASTGLPWLMVPINYFEHLRDVGPDLAAIETLCERTATEGLYAFTFDTIDGDATLHARAFAPLAGVAEDPVTGTAAGACAAYIGHHGAVDAEMGPVVVEQGHFVDRPGTVTVRVEGDDVRVGGQAATAFEGEIALPESDGDDIIEA
jgi:PhzF family phenazine biosynthesis protein